MSDSTSPAILGQVLRALRDRAKLSRAALADKVGSHHNQIQKLENGERTLTIDWIERLAPALGTTLQGFLSELPAGAEAAARQEAKTRSSIIEIEGDEFAKIPVYEIGFAAGPGALNETGEKPRDYQLISMSLIRSLTRTPINELWIFEVRGNSMEPILKDRDFVIIDGRKKNLRAPGIYTLDVEGEALIKHCSQHLETGAVYLSSENPHYAPQTIENPENLTVVGRLIFSMRRH